MKPIGELYPIDLLHGFIPRSQNCFNFMVKFFSKIEFENSLACFSGTQMDSNHEKNKGRKSRETHSNRIGNLFYDSKRKSGKSRRTNPPN